MEELYYCDVELKGKLFTKYTDDADILTIFRTAVPNTYNKEGDMPFGASFFKGKIKGNNNQDIDAEYFKVLSGTKYITEESDITEEILQVNLENNTIDIYQLTRSNNREPYYIHASAYKMVTPINLSDIEDRIKNSKIKLQGIYGQLELTWPQEVNNA